MKLKKVWYQSFKLLLKASLHCYTQDIKIDGRENIPKDEAVLFAANHPNALLDPLYIAAFNKREIHFLVRADVFKNPIVKMALGSLNLMPIYRIRDGRNQMANNEEVFKQCHQILKNKKALLIFPQGGHSRDRSIPALSKGFTRILFGFLEQHPHLNVHVVPVGITYQNSSTYPSKVAVRYGRPINLKSFLAQTPKDNQILDLKNAVSQQLQSLSVHIPKDDTYPITLNHLNAANVDFTEVNRINSIIRNKEQLPQVSKKRKLADYLFIPLVANNLFPYLIWQLVSKKIKDVEFVDTFRFGISFLCIPVFLTLQGWMVFHWTHNSWYVILYFSFSILLLLAYTKLASTHTEY